MGAKCRNLKRFGQISFQTTCLCQIRLRGIAALLAAEVLIHQWAERHVPTFSAWNILFDPEFHYFDPSWICFDPEIFFQSCSLLNFWARAWNINIWTSCLPFKRNFHSGVPCIHVFMEFVCQRFVRDLRDLYRLDSLRLSHFLSLDSWTWPLPVCFGTMVRMHLTQRKVGPLLDGRKTCCWLRI